ncbi:hypothetical protein [Staphylococcus saccharolyticus]|uniref:Membrane protein n=1 Tax=Staphylococcus saccharolyticus TaxID=33028 RepID=A0A380H1U7_9STAP|nr:hypothetical protein [Staphylococcus saccharolyticus]MBL7564990.1 hypothetical protein [Staphylococcus saccharolyticus]MBL7571973.1 hypothetical protein [Staphylococcus saccharolyticus]QQB98454.1 hypothetical protein I6I31_10875 [Staphylococcus saccharolyticus]QRJ67330.1 hypothetical protein DMB76_004960 [Staphylococcus saccharolyticus]RTX97781.1 hypothetical protein CD145_03335 [Staphylococcus saccharolyticus]
MSRSKKYFYLSLITLIVSFFFNTNNTLLSHIFSSFMKVMIATSLVNIIILIIAIIFADKSIKYSKESNDWIKVASKLLPIIILIVIIIHIFSSLHTFGFIF